MTKESNLATNVKKYWQRVEFKPAFSVYYCDHLYVVTGDLCVLLHISLGK